jgi:hypothetical protein
MEDVTASTPCHIVNVRAAGGGSGGQRREEGKIQKRAKGANQAKLSSPPAFFSTRCSLQAGSFKV